MYVTVNNIATLNQIALGGIGSIQHVKMQKWDNKVTIGDGSFKKMFSLPQPLPHRKGFLFLGGVGGLKYPLRV